MKHRLARHRRRGGASEDRKEVGSVTAILVALTIAVFLAVDFWHDRRRARVAAPARRALDEALDPDMFLHPDGLFYGSGHTWARLEANGTVRVGIDDFARRLLGRIDRIEVPPTGTKLGPRDAALVVRQQGKSAAFASPVEGFVCAVNEAVLRDPASLRGDLFGSGWLLQLEPRRLADNLRRLRVGDEARGWLREEVVRLRDFLAGQVTATAVGATLQDGGLPVEGMLEHLDDKAWERFESEFLAPS
jgi:glycine cleavage system H lipoate-binding protein